MRQIFYPGIQKMKDFFEMALFESDAADRKPQSEFAVQFGVREISAAGSIDLAHQSFVQRI